MSVSVTKSGFNVREKLKQLQKPIGLKGSELMRAETAQDARDFVSAGRKNLIINGGMDVWQRGTSFSDPASGSYTADRWKNSTNPTDISRSTDVPSGQPFTYSMLMAANGSGGTRHAALQGVELTATGNAGPFKVGTTWTFSCWLKGGANGSIFFGTDFRDDPNSGTNAVVISSTTFNYTTSWQKFTHTFTVGVSPGGTNLCLAIIFYNGTAPTHSLNITGCQLEVGKNATEFEHRSYGEELQLCKRYYEFGYFNQNVFTDQYTNATWQGEYEVEKRTSGTLTYQDSDGNSQRISRWFTSSYSTNVTPSGNSSDTTRKFSGYITSLTAGTLVRVGFHWQLNAEL